MNKIPKEGSQCIWLSVNLIDSVSRTGNNYYSQVFLEECMSKYIIDDMEISAEENSGERNYDEKY